MSGLFLYNTLTKRVDEFVPREEGTVRLYTCGPTVYHFAHIGNLRSYIMEDVLEKLLTYTGYQVLRVMNITDVGHLTGDVDTGEDKMLLGAKRENLSVLDLSKLYTKAFFEDCERLNIKKPETVVPATHCIDDFIEMIRVLMEKGYAYLAGGNVYFDTSKLESYHTLTYQSQEDLMVGVRDDVDEDTNKRNKTDFVLWFTKSKFDSQELKWESPWGLGYPGWHIECSSICIKHLGEYLDIHCGGIDNIFPHHTNEIAQSEAYLGHSWCKHWFHVQHLVEKSGKMSKSKGDFLTVSSLMEKKYNPLVYRLFCLQSHYRKPLEFSFEVLDNMTQTYNKLLKRIGELKVRANQEGNGMSLDTTTPKKAYNLDASSLDQEKIKEYREKFISCLGNDLNTSAAITLLYDCLKEDMNSETKLYLLADFDQVLSLDLLSGPDSGAGEAQAIDQALEEYIHKMIDDRNEARKKKDFATADQIRKDLASKGVTLKDTPEGTVFMIE